MAPDGEARERGGGEQREEPGERKPGGRFGRAGGLDGMGHGASIRPTRRMQRQGFWRVEAGGLAARPGVAPRPDSRERAMEFLRVRNWGGAGRGEKIRMANGLDMQ